METIENLRTKAFDALGRELSKKMPITTFVNGYIVGAQDQDRIARQEERERCIKAAQDVFCWMKCNKTNERGVCYAKEQERCFWHNQIRKAIDEG